MHTSPGEITELLADWSDGDPEALERLMPLVFEDLRQLARKHFRREPDGHTLQPTALVHEVYVRLAGQRKVEWDNRAQFFAFAAMLMRRILVDHAKARRTAKRGGGVRKLPLDDAFAMPGGEDLDVLRLDQALDELAGIDPRQARIVELRFFVGLTQEEVAEVMELSVTTVKREWRSARLWLFRQVSRN
jgi:RNA polymerase sigma factor (TIGR02999 family)